VVAEAAVGVAAVAGAVVVAGVAAADGVVAMAVAMAEAMAMAEATASTAARVAGGTVTAFASAAIIDTGLIGVSTYVRKQELGVSGNRHTF
jgi:hypothetical protein